MFQKLKISTVLIGICSILSCQSGCSKNSGPDTGGTNPTGPATEITSWITRGDKTALLYKQPNITFGAASEGSVISVDSATRFQTVDGFGYTLTGGSAMLINQLPQAAKTALLQELFGKNDNAIGISYLRLSIAASDLSEEVFSYNDLQPGQTDTALSHFNLSKDTVHLLPVLKMILAINPDIKLMGSPWSPPVWMKDNGKSVGGSLLPQYYAAYSKYFVKYIQAMKAEGITIDAITPQNEPLHPGNNPSLLMLPEQQADFIKNHLGPAFRAEGITTKIIVYDHNCDRPDYPITVLNDAGAKQFIDGSAFHLYAGEVNALTTVHNAHPDRNIYFTEQWTGAKGSFDGDLKWHIKNVIIGTMRNWSRVALEWNLANDANYNPHTPGGCTECKGALTIVDGGVVRNVAYYIIAHASKFVPAGSVRIGSDIKGNMHSVAFLTSDGKKVLIVLNDGVANEKFTISYKGKNAVTTLAAGAVATYTW